MELLSAGPLGAVFRVPNEKRILYKRHNFVQRVVGGSEETRKSIITVEKDPTSTVDCVPDAQERSEKIPVVDRLKALALGKPPALPIGPAMIGPVAKWSRQQRHGALRRPMPNSIPMKRRRIRRLCKMPLMELPFRNSDYTIVYPRLEPGEVPSPEFGPRLVPIAYPTNLLAHRATHPTASFTNCGHSQSANIFTDQCNTINLLPHVHREVAPTSVEATDNNIDDDTWTPPANPMKEVFQSAKAGIQKIVENCKQTGNVNLTPILLVPPPPIQGQADARKRKCSKRTKRPPSYAGVIFNSKNAELRHFSNRWVKGGRLTTTGEYEDASSDEERQEADGAAEVGRTLRQLEATPAFLDETNITRVEEPVQLYVVYEDTSEYRDYVQWYADTHGCSSSDAIEDEYQRYLRQWYHYYRTAVKFVDVEEADCWEGTGAETEPSSSSTPAAADAERCQRLMQQWRWQQINEWDIRTRSQQSNSGVVQEATSDGTTISGKPVTYAS